MYSLDSIHPVHFLNNRKDLSSTALIPFCLIGGNGSAMGVKIDHLEYPVCNSFKAKIVRDQLCYTVDPSLYTSYFNSITEISITLILNSFFDISKYIFKTDKVSKQESQISIGTISI